MIEPLKDLKYFVFNNSKIVPKIKSIEDLYYIYFGKVNLGAIPKEENLISVYGVLTCGISNEEYFLVVETKENLYHKKIDCDFNNFLNILFEQEDITEKIVKNISDIKLIKGDLYEMEVH